MITVSWLSPSDPLQSGSTELIDSWRQHGGHIWIDIEGKFTERHHELLSQFGCHELAIKDVSRDRHPPKVELFDEHTFVIFRGVSRIDDKLNIQPLQLSLFVGDNYLISLHSSASRSVIQHRDNPQLSRLLGHSKILAQSLMHFSAGLYLESLLNFDAELANIEDAMLERGSDVLLKDLIRYRSLLRKMRRNFVYHEVVSKDLIELWDQSTEDAEVSHRLRDLYDRCERLASLSTQQYEICGDLIDGYFSLTSHELNNTMRILTVVTAIFVPLSFLAGLYGMNFEYIPELKVSNGYFILLSVMLALAVGMIIVFKRKRWF